jgi:hypothetical protein
MQKDNRIRGLYEIENNLYWGLNKQLSPQVTIYGKLWRASIVIKLDMLRMFR